MGKSTMAQVRVRLSDGSITLYGAEGIVIDALKRRRIYVNGKTISVDGCALFGNKTWGMIDFLRNHCGYLVSGLANYHTANADYYNGSTADYYRNRRTQTKKESATQQGARQAARKGDAKPEYKGSREKRKQHVTRSDNAQVEVALASL